MFAKIPDFPGYFVSDDGIVGGSRGYLLPWIGNHGYATVSLRRDGKTYKRLVHRLMLLAFVGAPTAGQEACHNDGDRLNNTVENLRWDTRSANAKDRYAHGYAMSREARKSVSRRHKGRPLSAEHRAKLSKAKMGNKNRLGGKKFGNTEVKAA